MMTSLILGLKLLKRQWNNRLIAILTLSFILSISLLTTINMLGNRLNTAITNQSNALLGAPWVINSSRPLNPVWIEKATELGLRNTVVAEFMTMSIHKQQSVLSNIKAVSPPYPLIGALQSTHHSSGSPEKGHVWVASDWAQRYNTQIGDTLHIGDSALIVSDYLEREPDIGANIFNVAPRVMMNAADLPATHVIAPGSRIEYRLLIDGPQSTIKKYQTWIKPQLTENQQIIDVKTDRPELTEAIFRGQTYFVLVSFASVLLAGMTILLVMREYAKQQIDSVALLRTLGCSKRTLIAIYIGSLCIVGFLLSIMTVALSFIVQNILGNLLIKNLGLILPPPAFSDFIMGIFTGLLLIAGFSLPYLLTLIRTPPLKILHHDIALPSPRVIGLIFIILLTLFTLLALYSQDLVLSAGAMLVFATTFLVSAMAITVFIAIFGRAARWIKMPYKLGLYRVVHHRIDTIMQVLGITLSISLILSLVFIRFELLSQWKKALPDNIPNHFIYNVLPQYHDPLIALFDKHHVEHTDLFPIVMARLIAVNDRSIADMSFPANKRPNYTRRELNNTSFDRPREIDIVLDGEWWPVDSIHDFVSVEYSLAKTLNILVNDTLTFRAGDKTFTAQVANIRHVDWDNFQPNFYMIFSQSTLHHFPKTYMASFYNPDANAAFIDELTRSFPAATTISVAAVLNQVKHILSESTRFMSCLLVITTLATALLLYTSQGAQLQSRIKETVILRVLGASKDQLLKGWLFELIISSIIAGVCAYGLTFAICEQLSSYVLQLKGEVPLSYLFISIVLALLIQGLVGIRFFMRAQQQAPALAMKEN